MKASRFLATGALVVAALHATAQPSAAEWVPLGPYGGVVRDLVVDPAGTVWALAVADTARLLLFRSPDVARWRSGVEGLGACRPTDMMPGSAHLMAAAGCGVFRRPFAGSRVCSRCRARRRGGRTPARGSVSAPARSRGSSRPARRCTRPPRAAPLPPSSRRRSLGACAPARSRGERCRGAPTPARRGVRGDRRRRRTRSPVPQRRRRQDVPGTRRRAAGDAAGAGRRRRRSVPRGSRARRVPIRRRRGHLGAVRRSGAVGGDRGRPGGRPRRNGVGRLALASAPPRGRRGLVQARPGAVRTAARCRARVCAISPSTPVAGSGACGGAARWWRATTAERGGGW